MGTGQTTHPGRSRCAPTAVATAPDPPPSPRHPVLVALYLCRLAGSCGWEGAEPSQCCHAEGWPDPQPSDAAFSAVQSLGIVRASGLASPRQGAAPRRAEPLRQARGRFGSRLAAGPLSSCTLSPFPAPVQSDFLCQDSGANGAAPHSRFTSLPPGHLLRRRCLPGHRNAPDVTPKAIKSSQRGCSRPPSVPPSLVQLSKCFMALIPVALSTGVVLITCTFRWANADHVPLS